LIGRDRPLGCPIPIQTARPAVAPYLKFPKILKLMREKVRTSDYIMSTHADEEMDEDGLAIFDVEHVILTGEILERQKDNDTNEWKYRIGGQSVAGEPAEVIAKISPSGKLVIITVYRT
jgi:hypothetical protein